MFTSLSEYKKKIYISDPGIIFFDPTFLLTLPLGSKQEIHNVIMESFVSTLILRNWYIDTEKSKCPLENTEQIWHCANK